jgi:hypothetical protein
MAACRTQSRARDRYERGVEAARSRPGIQRDITDNIVTKQPPAAFWSATTIWKSIIGQHFFYRANNTKVKDITTELPPAFNKMADYLVAKLKLNTGRRKESLETPCEGVVNTSNAIFFNIVFA